MPDDDPADVELSDQRFDELLPGHLHHVTVEMQEYNIINTVKATDQIFPSNGACNELCLAAPDQIVGMNVKTDDGRTRAALQGTTLCHLQQRGVSDMDAVEKADRDHAMECFHDHTS